MKRLVAALLLIGIVLASGCLGGSDDDETTSAGPGVIITDFRSDFSIIDAGEPLSVMLDFENRGDMEALNVSGELVRKGAFIFNAQSNVYTSIDILESPLDTSFAGDEFVWDMTAPNVAQERTEEVQARIHYDYETIGFATIHFVPRDMIRDQGVAAFPIDVSSTEGPISIDVKANQPIILRAEAFSQHTKDNVTTNYINKTARITILLSNEWTGKVETDNTISLGNCSLSGGGLQPDCVEYLEVEALGGGCSFWKDNKIVGSGQIENKTGVRMVQSKEGRYHVSVPFAVKQKDAATSCQIKITARYSYRVDSDVLPINIKPY